MKKTRGRPPSGGREEILKATLDVLRERGIARLTTREVAERAGVSEGSIFYHFVDRPGLLKAVFENSLDGMKNLTSAAYASNDIRTTLNTFAKVIADFLDSGLDVLIAAQADAELRGVVVDFLVGNDYGPHRGIAGIGHYLAEQQAAGVIRSDIDPKIISYLIVSDAFQRAAQPKLFGQRKGVPGQDAFFTALMTLIAPVD
ncbi:MAG: regulatory protein TetR [Aeromicrobium sp.]|nr:regulatory protein TetR [Aeromicrobium sp.]